MSNHRGGPHCHRTRGLIDREVADRVTADDFHHAETCDTCGPVLARASRFDDELRRSTEQLVGERLPQGVLDPELTPRLVTGLPSVRQAMPGLASVFAAVAVVLIAAAVALVPGGFHAGSQPPASPPVAAPLFRATVDIIQAVRASDYSCIPGHTLPTSGPSAGTGVREGVICLTPQSIESANASIIPIENEDGNIVEVTIKGSLFGTETLTSRSELATVMGRLTFDSITDPTRAAEAGAFIERSLPQLKLLPTGDDANSDFGPLRVALHRYPGGSFILTLEPVHPG